MLKTYKLKTYSMLICLLHIPFTACCRQYKVYDLSSPSYSLLYCLPAAGITDVKLGSSYILLVREAVQRQKQQQQHHHDQQQQQEQLEDVGSHAAVVLPLEVLSAVNGMVSRRDQSTS
jgi:hypothetical protein